MKAISRFVANRREEKRRRALESIRVTLPVLLDEDLPHYTDEELEKVVKAYYKSIFEFADQLDWGVSIRTRAMLMKYALGMKKGAPRG